MSVRAPKAGSGPVTLGPPRDRLPGAQAVDCASNLAEAFNVSKTAVLQSQLAEKTWDNIQKVHSRTKSQKQARFRKAGPGGFRSGSRCGNAAEDSDGGGLASRGGGGGDDDDDGSDSDDSGRQPTDLLDFVASLTDRVNGGKGGESVVVPVWQQQARIANEQRRSSSGAARGQGCHSGPLPCPMSGASWARGSAESLPLFVGTMRARGEGPSSGGGFGAATFAGPHPAAVAPALMTGAAFAGGRRGSNSDATMPMQRMGSSGLDASLNALMSMGRGPSPGPGSFSGALARSPHPTSGPLPPAPAGSGQPLPPLLYQQAPHSPAASPVLPTAAAGGGVQFGRRGAALQAVFGHNSNSNNGSILNSGSLSSSGALDMGLLSPGSGAGGWADDSGPYCLRGGRDGGAAKSPLPSAAGGPGSAPSPWWSSSGTSANVGAAPVGAGSSPLGAVAPSPVPAGYGQLLPMGRSQTRMMIQLDGGQGQGGEGDQPSPVDRSPQGGVLALGGAMRSSSSNGVAGALAPVGARGGRLWRGASDAQQQADKSAVAPAVVVGDKVALLAAGVGGVTLGALGGVVGKAGGRWNM